MSDSVKNLPEKPVVLLLGSESDLKSVPQFPGINFYFQSRRERAPLPENSTIGMIFSQDPALIESWTKRLRGDRHLALLPLAVFSSLKSPVRVNAAIDRVYPSLPTREGLLNVLAEWQPLLNEIGLFPPLPDRLPNEKKKRAILLRYLLSRGLEKLEPERDFHSRIGYFFPIAETILQTKDFDECDTALRALENRGFLRSEFADTIHICSFCGHFHLNFREVCSHCRNANLAEEINIHHFRCGYIGSETEFLSRGMRCPKCRRQLKHIGVDYDQPAVSFRCLCCENTFGEPLVSCLCIKCGREFPVEKAIKQVVRRYFLTSEGKRYARNGPWEIPVLIKSEWGLLDFEIFEEIFSIQTAIAKRSEKKLLLILVRGEISRQAENKIKLGIPPTLTGQLAAVLKETLRTEDIITAAPGGGVLALASETFREKAGYIVKRIRAAFADSFGNSLRPIVTLFECNNSEVPLKEAIEKLYVSKEITGHLPPTPIQTGKK